MPSNDVDVGLGAIIGIEPVHSHDECHQACAVYHYNKRKAALTAWSDRRTAEVLERLKHDGQQWEEPNEGTVYELNKLLEALSLKDKDQPHHG